VHSRTSARILYGKVVVVKFNFDTSKAIYMQIIDEIKRAIARGQLKPGDKILSQREMAAETQVNPNTVQRAYQEMERIGLIETLRGQGSFITQNPQLMAEVRSEMTARALQTFKADMTALGYTFEEIQALVQESISSST
jgi:GntR family transcriptional regulator